VGAVRFVEGRGPGFSLFGELGGSSGPRLTEAALWGRELKSHTTTNAVISSQHLPRCYDFGTAPAREPRRSSPSQAETE
jgi:hypothetical protein